MSELLRSVAETVREAEINGDGFWRTCSGCAESADGVLSYRDYPFSDAFRCQLGGGCFECGGIGAVWDTTDYGAMADEMLAEDRALGPQVRPFSKAFNGFALIRRMFARAKGQDND